MKLNDLTKFSLSLALIPVIPSFLVFKYFNLKAGVIVLAIFWLISFLTFINKSFAKILRSLFAKIGEWLGKYLADIALFLIFIFAVIPTKFFMLLARRDRLLRRTVKDDSYWVEYCQDKTDYELEY